MDAAIRQLETAITLWFHDGDPVSICTLTWAAYEIIHHFNKAGNHDPMMVDGSHIKPEYREAFPGYLKEGANFLKHASRDPKSVYHLPVKSQPFVLLDAAAAYNNLKLGKRPLFEVLILWMRSRYPDIFPEPLARSPASDPLFQTSKAQFYADFLPMFTARIAGAMRP